MSAATLTLAAIHSAPTSAADLPPLNDAQAARVAALLSSVRPKTGGAS